MAHRPTLQDFQIRLARRLQAATTEGQVGAAWLALECSGRFFLVPLAQAGGIFPWQAVQAVPYTQAWFLGVVPLRGALVGVVDLGGLLGLAPPASPDDSPPASLLTFHPSLDVNAALRVGRLLGLRGADAFVASEPAPAGAAAYGGPVWVDAAGLRWQELSLQALARDAAFLHIAA
ncbi:MAG: chemotaxis protein CheW [Burkholderiaceae bacterium]|nr:chemotaxis protein CheW [Burkholderiaceae bacterium]